MAMLIEPGRVECLHLPVHNLKHASFELDYQVIEGGENDISFMLKNPKGVVLAQDVKRMDGAHKVELAQEQNGYGDYAFCFDNSFSVRTTKRVFFEIFLLDKEGNYLNDYDLKELGEKVGRSESLEGFQVSPTDVEDGS
jgi:protein ERP2